MTNHLDPEGATRVLIPADIPNSQLREFFSKLTGDDNDILLAAEYAVRDCLTPGTPFDGEVEFGYPRVEISGVSVDLDIWLNTLDRA